MIDSLVYQPDGKTLSEQVLGTISSVHPLP